MPHLMEGFNESEYLCSDYRCSNFSSQSTEKVKISTSGHPGRQRSFCLRFPLLLNNVIMTSPVFLTIIKVFASLINLTDSCLFEYFSLCGCCCFMTTIRGKLLKYEFSQKTQKYYVIVPSH